MAKRKMIDTWKDLEALNLILRSGKYPKGVDILGIGSGNFYQCVMKTMLAIRSMKRKTKENARDWNFHDERAQLLLKIARLTIVSDFQLEN